MKFDKMKLLCVSYALPPFNAPQSMQIGRLLYYLPSEFEQYAVFAEVRGSQKDAFYPDLRSKFKDSIAVPISVNRYLEIIKSRIPVLYKTPDSLKDWNEKAYLEISRKWKSEKFDAIITFAYPFSSHRLGIKLKKLFNTRWIAHFSDPWARNPYNRYDFFSRSINAKLEKEVVETADICIFVSEELRDDFAKLYPDSAHKFRVLEHSFDSSLYPGKYENPEPKKLLLRYIGNFYGARSPEPLFKALVALKREGKLAPASFRFEIIGGGMRVPMLISKYGLSDLVFQSPPVSYVQSLGLMQASDVLAVIDGDIREDSVFLPSKLIDYIGSGRPVMGITPKGSASERVIRDCGGLLAEPKDTQEIARMLLELARRKAKSTLGEIAPRKRTAYKYEISCKIKEFVMLLKEALA